jgi:hypothetical protein
VPEETYGLILKNSTVKLSSPWRISSVHNIVMLECFSPARMRMVHRNMMFRPGSKKYVVESLTVTGAAKIAMAHS